MFSQATVSLFDLPPVFVDQKQNQRLIGGDPELISPGYYPIDVQPAFIPIYEAVYFPGFIFRSVLSQRTVLRSPPVTSARIPGNGVKIITSQTLHIGQSGESGIVDVQYRDTPGGGTPKLPFLEKDLVDAVHVGISGPIPHPSRGNLKQKHQKKPA
jgi:hypothetical protein